MKELIDRFISTEDKNLISEITGTDFNELCNIPEWNKKIEKYFFASLYGDVKK